MEPFATYPSLAGRSVLITGGASGIGAAIVRQFCMQKSKVAFVDIDPTAGMKARSMLAAEGLIAPHFIACDLRDIDALRAAVEEAARVNGPVTVLINNAARDDRHALEEVTSDYWDERIAVNLKHQFFAAQAVFPMMKAAGGGSIVNLGSVSWMIGQGNMPCYTTAKAAVVGLTRALARDMGPFNIRVNSLAPGWIMTERQIQMWLTPEGERQLMERQCLKRKLVPDDMARICLFLAAEDSGAMTNQTYVADGGWV